MEQRHKSNMMSMLGTRIKAGSFDGLAVFLFGHCNATEEMADYLLDHKVTPAAILDNSVSKQGLTYRSITILPPEEIRMYAADNSIVLISTRFYAEMEEQLRRFGYDGEIVQVVEYDSFAEFSLSDETIERKTERMYQGVKTLEAIRLKYPSQHLVMCPNNALGDVYWTMSFLPSYMGKNGIKEVAIVVIGNACCETAKLFEEPCGADNIVTLNQTEMDELVQAIIFTRDVNSIIAHHDRPYTDNIIRWLDKHFLSFVDYYRCAVYGLDRSTPPVPPSNFAAFDNHEQVPKDKGVILSPYAKSVVKLPSEFWEDIVTDYKAQGYKVYTNVVGDELPVKGTAPLNVPISQMISAAEHAGTFIGIRSGLCDIINTAECRKVVVFPDCYYSTTPYKAAEFFALPGWETIIY